MDALAKILPIIMMVAIGKGIQKKQFLNPETVREVKELIMQIAMPAVLFRAFIWMDLKPSQLSLSFAIIVLLSVIFAFGFILRKVLGGKDSFLPYTVTSMAFGLLSIPLFIAVFGMDNLSYISLLGVGHELFVWFIYYNTMKLDYKSERLQIQDFSIIFKSRIMWAVIVGVSLNLLGIAEFIHTNPLLATIDTTLAYLASLATPMILLIIGYTIRINPVYLKQAAYYVGIRYLLIGVIGYLFKLYVFNPYFEPTAMLNHAYVTLLVTCPGFSLPLFAERYAGEEYVEVANNFVVLSLFATLVLFTGYLMMVGV